MNRAVAQAILPALTAFAEGKGVQCRRRLDGPEAEWEDINDPSFTTSYEYRVKPTNPIRGETRKRKDQDVLWLIGFASGSTP